MSLMLNAISQTSERSSFSTLSTFADSKTKDCFPQKTLGTFVGGGVGGGGGGGGKTSASPGFSWEAGRVLGV